MATKAISTEDWIEELKSISVLELSERIKALEEEIIVLRRRLQDAPKRVRTLEERLLETKGQLAQAVSQNEKLSATLREAREHIAALRAAGFAEIGTLWQYGENRILCGIMPG